MAVSLRSEGACRYSQMFHGELTQMQNKSPISMPRNKLDDVDYVRLRVNLQAENELGNLFVDGVATLACMGTLKLRKDPVFQVIQVLRAACKND